MLNSGASCFSLQTTLIAVPWESAGATCSASIKLWTDSFKWTFQLSVALGLETYEKIEYENLKKEVRWQKVLVLLNEKKKLEFNSFPVHLFPIFSTAHLPVYILYVNMNKDFLQ